MESVILVINDAGTAKTPYGMIGGIRRFTMVRGQGSGFRVMPLDI